MNKRIASCLAILACAWTGAGEGPDTDYYRSEVLPRESGVYARDGVLYVHSTAPVDARMANASRAKMQARAQALLGVDALLKSWAVSNAAPLRAEAGPRPAGLAYAEQLLAARDPEWRFASWNLASLPVRQVFNAAEGGRYVCAYEVQKDALLAKLPEAFRTPCSEGEVLAGIRTAFGPRLNGPKARQALARCGVCDGVGTDGVAEPVAAEFDRVNGQVRTYLAESAFARQVREEAQARTVPQCVTNRTVWMNAQGTLCVETNAVVTVTRIPRFQLLLLDPQSGTNAALPRLESGVQAAAAFADGSLDRTTRAARLKAALEENPGDGELWNLYGRVLAETGEHAAAVSCFRNALKLEKASARARIGLAAAYKALGFERLCWALAVAVYAAAADDWSVAQAELLLLDGRRAAPVPVPPAPVQAPPAPAAEPVPAAPAPAPAPAPAAKPAGKGILSNEVMELDL